jgi:ferredoxin
MGRRLRLDPTACDGHGNCGELLPELITIDRWGFPVLDGADVPRDLEREARRAVALCPKLALRLERSGRED